MEASLKFGNLEVRGLPPRQAETLIHTARGLNSKETAKAMHISPRTVEMNLNMAMARFGAANRVHLIIQAITAGALVIKDAAMCLFVSFFLLFAAMPGATVQSADDLTRVPARNLRLRRKNDEDGVALTHLTEEYA